MGMIQSIGPRMRAKDNAETVEHARESSWEGGGSVSRTKGELRTPPPLRTTIPTKTKTCCLRWRQDKWAARVYPILAHVERAVEQKHLLLLGELGLQQPLLEFQNPGHPAYHLQPPCR